MSQDGADRLGAEVAYQDGHSKAAWSAGLQFQASLPSLLELEVGVSKSEAWFRLPLLLPPIGTTCRRDTGFEVSEY